MSDKVTPLTHIPAVKTMSSHSLVEGLERAYENSYDAFVGYACFFVPTQEIAEEIVQDVFIDTIVRAQANRSFTIDNLSAFIKAAIVNKSKNIHRRNYLRVVKEETVSHSTPTQHVDALNEDEEAIFASITSLTPIQKQCVLLRFWEDKTTVEIADELNISKSTVKTHLQRACSAIEKCMDASEG